MVARERTTAVHAAPSHTSRSTSRSIVAALLLKLAKHLALIACLMIIGGASGRFATSGMAAFLTVVAAAALHSIGRVFARHLPASHHLTLSGHDR